MPQLHLAANLAQNSLIFGHLQIVYDTGDGSLLEAESTSPGFPYFWGDWVYPTFARPHDTIANTPGYGDPQTYAIAPLELAPGQQAEDVWSLIGQIHAAFSNGGHGIDYDADQNSNSFAATLLWAVGIDVAPLLDAVTPPSVQSFAGVETNVLLGAKTGGFFSGHDTPIPLQLTGTRGNDVIRTGIGDDSLTGGRGQDTILAGAGADSLWGGRGDDSLSGGAGSDFLQGNRGADRLFGDGGDDVMLGGKDDDLLTGGAGNDLLRGQRQNDRLEGGAGQDTLEGGLADDTLEGGAGADLFLFDDGRDHILDFEDDIDVIAIHTLLADGAMGGQQLVDRFGRLENDAALLDFGGYLLRIDGVDDLQSLIDDLTIY